MKLLLKVLRFVALGVASIIFIYIIYLWATYIDVTVTSGTKYGFTIGSSKQSTYQDVLRTLKDNPNTVIFIITGPRAGDMLTLYPVLSSEIEASQYDRWSLLLDGRDHFFNNIKLTFEKDTPLKIHRHRKHFEVP